MKARRCAAGMVLALAFTTAGCTHRVVATSGDHTVKLYRDEATYEKIKGLKREGGPIGMLGGMGEVLATKQLDNNTPVRIISQDSEGAQIEVTDGPLKGEKGFVAKDNIS